MALFSGLNLLAWCVRRGKKPILNTGDNRFIWWAWRFAVSGKRFKPWTSRLGTWSSALCISTGNFTVVARSVAMVLATVYQHWALYGASGIVLGVAALMRSGWLKGQFSLFTIAVPGFVLVAIGDITIALQWRLNWAYRCCAFTFLRFPRD